MKIEIFIPCFNEELNLKELITSWKNALNQKTEYQFSVVFIDNGSSDHTKDVISALISDSPELFTLLIKNVNTGYGDGVMYGVRNSSADFIGWAHADLQFDPKKIIKKLNCLPNEFFEEHSFLTGRRLKRNFFDSIFTKMMTLIVFIFTFKWISDINAQPKIFSKDLLSKFKNPPSNFNLDLYTLLLAKKNNYKFKYLHVDYKDRKYGIAKGGGTLKGKFKLSYQVFRYLIIKK